MKDDATTSTTDEQSWGEMLPEGNEFGANTTAAPVDTWWTNWRWWAATRFNLLAMKMAPAGTAKDRWREYNQEWAHECAIAGYVRYFDKASQP